MDDATPRLNDEQVFAAMEPFDSGSFANHATPLVRNCWYVCARRAEIGRAPLARRLLDVDVVMYRTQGGQPVAMRNRCPHRAFPLSRGKLAGDRLVCGYHGMAFEPSGLRASAPACPPSPMSRRMSAWPPIPSSIAAR